MEGLHLDRVGYAFLSLLTRQKERQEGDRGAQAAQNRIFVSSYLQ
jgi:hypothetical protein